MEEDGDQDETQEQQEGILEQMETEEQDTIEAPIKRGMGISVAPEKYQPASPRYIEQERTVEMKRMAKMKKKTLRPLIWPLNLHYPQD